ncbi:DUF7706 family protein [Vibrio metschnikovii]|jgi:hypothetical protein|uniref:DUF7706 family protein n=1 Tax=Vibrio metschnikovii TaxID=28172 RepID=UPI001C2F300D|nr:hypothetical protein [Vibrio metschnikovii]
MEETTTITTELSDRHAWALAQLVKRIGWNEVRINAADDDDAYLMREALSALQKSLAESGYAPR